MSTPGTPDGEAAPVDPAAEQALPADAGVAAGGTEAPEPETRVHDVPAPEGASGAVGASSWLPGVLTRVGPRRRSAGTGLPQCGR